MALVRLEGKKVFVNILSSLRGEVPVRGGISSTCCVKMSISQSPKTAIQAIPHRSKMHLLCVNMLVAKAGLAEARNRALVIESLSDHRGLREIDFIALFPATLAVSYSFDVEWIS